MRVNPECMFLKYFKGKLFENGKRYAKSETTVQKALERRIPNHFLHIQFERKTSVSQSNLLYPLHRVYVYNSPKTTENAKSRQYVYFETAPKAIMMALLHTSFYIIAFGLSGGFFVESELTTAYLSGKGGKGGGGKLFPLLGPLSF